MKVLSVPMLQYLSAFIWWVISKASFIHSFKTMAPGPNGRPKKYSEINKSRVGDAQGENI